ncbi:DUF4430 domain-containing protein [Paenibacillus lycopersici]|uniref:DUF4430 domain-containing protein n=1 Tax=Paenibacillus lycopersici TaxID=2704462 RepID=A0A6C0G7Q8_9BACL|nr:DUF4430 domain-containing protein [Paenibacillus lycopersici]
MAAAGSGGQQAAKPSAGSGLSAGHSGTAADNAAPQPPAANAQPGKTSGKQVAASGQSAADSQTSANKPAGADKGASGSGSGSNSSGKPAAKDKYQTEPVPAGKPAPSEPQQADINKKKALTATLFVSCQTILDRLDDFDPDKLEVLPKDGIIFARQTVTFYEGESVFDVLLREMKKRKIHMEFEMTPLYNSNYIEGIHNIYEFDCGELSGWMYRVNDWFPNYGASRYKLKDGDAIEWLYTCDLGRDIGGGQAGSG